ncbi:heme o synthase [Robiginitalea sp. SC105]|uniref:heme o synthase n=1 Tax=Robiginitalea sp. SC105 TaxID=2762332 RepID=UPI00163AE394|nr:heme o synthase [Robiginitalea sp. SC105]MBC2838785.1 protoheme IX farnesyltransferase [Robiginitalea sp. SC105]
MKSATGTAEPGAIQLAFTDFKEITKAKLALSVVFSAVAGYFLGAQEVRLLPLSLLILGGYCMVGASNAYNQVIERTLDKKMHRTRHRPIPSGRMGVATAMAIAIAMTLAGVLFLYQLNPRTAFFGALSIFLYTCVYTPLKTVTPLAVFVGAIPGAIPFMLGWVAATDDFGIEPGTLFMIQFFWQFPHFWALGWMLDEDYRRGGFKMLPTGKKDTGTAVQIIMYTIWMIVISIIPVFGITGRLSLSVPAAVLVFLMGLGMLWFALRLYERRDRQSARSLMLSSVTYISLMQIVYVADSLIT